MKKILIFLLLISQLGQAQNLFARQNFAIQKNTFPYLLDTYTGAQIAYSFRKLRSAYSGNCIKVRRSSDNTTLDIGFVANVLDTASLLTFVGGGNGFIEIWYDQSGNANNLVQFTQAAQPQIVLSGAVITKAGKPALYSPTTAQMECSDLFLSPTYDSAFTVFQNELSGNDGTYAIPFSTSFRSNSNFYGICSSGSGAASYQGWGTPFVYKNGSGTAVTNTRGDFYTAFRTGAIVLLSEFVSATLPSQDRGLQYNTGGFKHVCYVQEHITYISNQTSNKSGIEANINAFYAIY